MADRTIFIIGIILFIFVFLSGCTGNGTGSAETSAAPINRDETTDPGANTGSLPLWMQVPMTDCRTGSEISVSFSLAAKKPLIIQTFTIWCPACTYQLQETNKLLNEYPERYEALAIDIEMREGKEDIAGHISRNSLSKGHYAAAREEVLLGMIQSFGREIILTMPRTVVICNGTVYLFQPGAIPAPLLKQSLEDLC